MKQYTENGTVLQIKDASFAVNEKTGWFGLGKPSLKTIIHKINILERDIHRQGTKQGQLIAIVGRSGRGKSTLLRLLAALAKATSGSVQIVDNGNMIDIEEGMVGFVDQKYTLLAHRTIQWQLEDAAQTGRYKNNANDVIDQLVTSWGLDSVRYQYPVSCSGGQRQRVAILKQILSSDHYLILDEPFSGLDVGNVEDVKSMLRQIDSIDELNTTIFSTHDIELAVEMADKIYVVGFEKNENGELGRVGTIVETFDLKKLGLAWEKFGPAHQELVQKVKQAILNS